jgi:hypothetical protein
MEEGTHEDLSEDPNSLCLSGDEIDVKGLYWSSKHDDAAVPENMT